MSVQNKGATVSPQRPKAKKAKSKMFASFNNIFSNLLRKENAVIVGPSKQLTGEFPEITKERLYEFYNGWPQIKRSIDTDHQKFIGAGIDVTTDNESFNLFWEKWSSIVNFQRKMSQFFLATFVTGDGLLELQWTPDGKLGNIADIPITTIFRIFRDSFANEEKIVQVVDGVFKEINPDFYVHFMINNSDKQAFGRSEFHTLATPRKVRGKVDPLSGESINPDRSLVSLLEAQAELQNAEVEIKKKLAKPRIFASFPNMPKDQLDALQKDLEDESSDKYIYAFNREAKMEEASISTTGKFDEYGKNIDSMISLGTGFAAEVVTNAGSFSYASSQTPFDILDQRMIQIQSDASELIIDEILRPLALSWGFEDFDEWEKTITFLPTVKRLALEDILRLPSTAVGFLELRKILKDTNVPLDDDLFKESRELEKQMQPMENGAMPFEQDNPDFMEDIKKAKPETEPQSDPIKRGRPEPPRTDSREIKEFIVSMLRNPKLFENYISTLVRKQTEHLLLPKSLAHPPEQQEPHELNDGSQQNSIVNGQPIGALNFSGGSATDFQSQEKPPIITDPEIEALLMADDPRKVEPETPDDPLHEEPQPNIPNDTPNAIPKSRLRTRPKRNNGIRRKKEGPRTPDSDDLKSSGGIDKLP